MIATICFALAGGIVRLVDGSAQPVPGLPFKIPNGVRVASIFALCLSAWTITLGFVPIAPVCAAWCMLALIMGQTNWTDWLWMPMRFALFGFAASWSIGIDMWHVPAVMALAGISYPFMFWIDERMTLPRLWIVDGPEAYARFVCGGLCCAAPLL